MKNIIILLVMMLLPMVARAETVEIDGIYYELVSKAKQAEVKSNPNKYTGNVVIPASVTYEETEYSVTSIGNSAFSGCSGLTSVTIPNSVTSIGKYAFEGCSGLTSVTIPNSVTSIGNYAFEYCSSLTSVTIPNSVTSIGEFAFYGCSSMTVHISDLAAWCNIKFNGYGSNPISGRLFLGEEEITDLVIPNSVTSIGDYAFSSCSGLTSITIPNSVTSIGMYTFSGCSGLTSITIPNSVTSIGSYAFSRCSGLTSVTIPNSVTSIGEGAFWSCNGLNSVTIGSGVKNIYSKAFASCKELTDVYCLAEKVPSTNADAFKDSYIEYATLHVSATSINDYKTIEPWKYFKNFKTIEEQQLPKCFTPTISFDKSGLVFNCETPDVEYSYEIKNTDVKKGFAEGNRVSLAPVYTITVQAVKAGWENSDVATATIRWRNGSPVFQGFTKVDAGEGALWGDVNIDGQVDVADIANIIDIMAGK